MTFFFSKNDLNCLKHNFKILFNTNAKFHTKDERLIDNCVIIMGMEWMPWWVLVHCGPSLDLLLLHLTCSVHVCTPMLVSYKLNPTKSHLLFVTVLTPNFTFTNFFDYPLPNFRNSMGKRAFSESWSSK